MTGKRGIATKPSRLAATSKDINSLKDELNYAGDRDDIIAACETILVHLEGLQLPETWWDYLDIGRSAKRNFAQRFSQALAQKISNALRPSFPGVLPDEAGRGQESKSGAAGGLKKLDVNYSTTTIGLGFGVSVKTVNFRDSNTKRYTKNIKRVDGELRAEADDYHTRQPYAVLVALVLFPEEAAFDGTQGISSFHHASEVFARRSGRASTVADHSAFEALFLGVYKSSGPDAGQVRLYQAGTVFPAHGLPSQSLKFSDMIEFIKNTFAIRNKRR